MPPMRDTPTRFQGVYARHRRGCTTFARSKCPCRPSYWAKAWDRASGRAIRTTMRATPLSASEARRELLEELRQGRTPVVAGMRVKAAGEAFVRSARDGVALNKHSRRYKPSAVADIESCLNNHIEGEIGRRRLADVRRGDVQRIVDGMVTDGKSGSRVRSVVNAIRSLYAWAQDRDLAQHDPASRVRLPAMDATPRDRVATAVEMAGLLDALPVLDALPYAIAVYATARRAEIRHLRLDDVDLTLGVIYLGADEGGRKSRAAQRAVPIVRPLASILRRAALARRPDAGELLCPGSKPGGRNSGMLSFEALQTRADDAWDRAKLTRITAHECRHTCATWLDAAGVRSRVVSELMGHSVMRPGEGAAITKQRYTHLLPEDLALAGRQLDGYIAAAVKARAARGDGTG